MEALAPTIKQAAEAEEKEAREKAEAVARAAARAQVREEARKAKQDQEALQLQDEAKALQASFRQKTHSSKASHETVESMKQFDTRRNTKGDLPKDQQPIEDTKPAREQTLGAIRASTTKPDQSSKQTASSTGGLLLKHKEVPVSPRVAEKVPTEAGGLIREAWVRTVWCSRVNHV